MSRLLLKAPKWLGSTLTFRSFVPVGAQAVINGMSLKAISEGSELSPKVYHEDMSNALTLTTKYEEINACIAGSYGNY